MMASPIFYVYPDGYGTAKKIPVFEEKDLQALVIRYPDACVSSTKEYEQRLADKASELSKRWEGVEWKL